MHTSSVKITSYRSRIFQLRVLLLAMVVLGTELETFYHSIPVSGDDTIHLGGWGLCYTTPASITPP